MKTYCSDKDVNKFVKSLIKQGWTYTKGKKHGKLSADFTDLTVTISSSPSDRRYLMVLKQLLKRNNLIV
jgi:hypothetical protein